MAFVLRYIVETKGRTLEETAVLFDGDTLPDDLVARGGEAATMTMTRDAADIHFLSQPSRDEREHGEKLPTDFLELQNTSSKSNSNDHSSIA